MRGQNLDGYSAAQPRVARAINLAHPARAQGAEDLVRSSLVPTTSSIVRAIILRKGSLQPIRTN
jgi:hypothetical protein